MRVVDIERGEPAVRALHPHEPVQRASQRLTVALRLGRAMHGPDDHCRVVEIRVMSVGELERPATARKIRPLHLPVARLVEKLLVFQPVE